MDLDEGICENLCQWLKALDFPGSSEVTVDTLATGKPIAVFLSTVDEDFFNEEWRSKIQEVSPEETNKWRIKASNLRKVLKQLVEFYDQVLQRSLPQGIQPDVTSIAQNNDKSALAALLRLLVFASMNAPGNTVFVQKTVTMDMFVQEAVMQAVTVITDAAQSQSDSEEKIKALMKELDATKEELNETARRFRELDHQMFVLQEEKATLSKENEKFMSTMVDTVNLEDPSSPAGRKFHQAQQNIDRLNDSLQTTELEKEDLLAKLTTISKENEDLKLRVGELAEMELKNSELKDQVDELSTKAEDAKKYEEILGTYRRKIEEHSDLKAQLKLLQEKNNNYMQSVIQLEDEQRKNSALKMQLEAYKRQMQEAEDEKNVETRRADKAEFEWKRAREKQEGALAEKERLGVELQRLRDSYETMKLDSTSEFGVSSTSDADSSANSGGLGEILAGGSMTELKEQVLRLEIENQRLKDGVGEEVSLVRSQLDDVLSKKQELETELRLSHQKMMELEHKIEENQELEEKTKEGGDARLASLHSETELMRTETERLRRQATESESVLSGKDERLKKLEAEVTAKDIELKNMEAKFKTYMEKARTALVGLEENREISRTNSSVSTGDSPLKGGDMESLRKEVEKKDKEIQKLHEEQEKMRILAEQEQRLMTTAFHSLACEAQRSAGTERMSNASAFLGRQRQATSRRAQPQLTQPTASSSGMSTR